jgi:IS605 OrfB family transposase
MDIFTTYDVKIKRYNHIFKDTVAVYRRAVDFLIGVCDAEWDSIVQIGGKKQQRTYVESIVHRTKSHPTPKYDFDSKFYKMPCYMLRAAIMDAIGKVASYRSNLKNWNLNPKGNAPSLPKAGRTFPAMYRGNMYVQTSDYVAQVKVYIRNTWDWITLDLKKSDIDYITHHCSDREHCAPSLVQRGKEWFLSFPFKEKVDLHTVDIVDQTVVAVDLGINTAATISVMRSDGTILDRRFCKLTQEIDHLSHALNRIKKAQQNRNHKTPRLWAKVKGINHDISAKTAAYIMDVAMEYNADTIVFEHLDRNGKIRGSKKQKIHMWRSQEVQSIVANKAHRLGMRISRICAWGTSRLAYDGSGRIKRGKEAELPTYELCQFQNGKIYNCDLSASYNIGARYFIRELLKSEAVMSRLSTEPKDAPWGKRSTCTLSTLISLNAALATSTLRAG